MKLGFCEVFDDYTSRCRKIPKEEYLSNGKYIVIDQGQNNIAGYTNIDDGLFEDVPAIVFGDHTRIIKYVDEPFFLGADGVKLLKSKIKDANYKYLYYVLRNARIPDTGYNRHFKWLKEINLEYKDAESQKNIVKTLDTVTNIIELYKVELSKLDNLIRARFVEMFGDPSVNNKRWQRGVINEIGSCIAGATPSTKVDEYWNNGTIPWMSSGEVNKGRIDRTDNFITHLGYDKTSTKLVPPKTVVLAMAGQGRTRGMAAITEIELCTNQSICSIVNNEKIDAEYLLYFLKRQYNELRRASTNTDGRGGLNLKIIGNYPIIIPPVGLQKRFANFVEQVNKSKLLSVSQPQIHIYKTLTLL
ncbi:type I restriction modification DNA specificity domain protein [Lachnoanaerobaculum sp. MSX33]|uniref:restriction endonuclease subunit S n=1 Tax=Lachnoanaerobaculum sp. MSX33 TaxID=936596 RepID=UPI0003DF9BBB|nr:restriction endonuclease subunit S [Lachnoanaerobaculum sp. MSX33]ETO97463.1 type I restriction modification DNA specificity domain protein [Lachnoanaerobaculum sp. MSX33]